MLDISILSKYGVRQKDAPVDSMESWGMLEPDGVYDVTRTYEGGGVLLLDKHLDRLENSARSEAIPLDYERHMVRRVVRDRLVSRGFGPSRLRFCIARERPDELIITLEEIGVGVQILASLKRNGVHVELEHLTRQNPGAKTNKWVRQRNSVLAAKPSDSYERLIVSDQGELLEGFSSNFFGIRHAQIFTAEEGRVLPGIARHVVFEAAKGICEVNFQSVHVDGIESLDEAFMTSSGRGIVPIIRIGDVILSDGRPGPHTRQLMDAYDTWAADHIEWL